MRSYDEPIHVLFADEPRQFIWRERLLLVKHVQERWSRAAPWWESDEADLLSEREIWRVEAGNGHQRGVYELARTAGCEDWVLKAVLD